jgi:hypothetical protein
MQPRIFITTYKRPNNQRTWVRLTPKLQKDTVLVVDWEERDLYKNYPILVLPKGLSRLSPKRQFLLQNATGPRIILLDDDLQFYARKRKMDWHLRAATPEDTEEMFAAIFTELGDFAHVGVSPREGNNRFLEEKVQVSRMMRLLGYNLPAVRAIVKFPLVDCMEDFDLTLQLLSHGITNTVFYKWSQGQKDSNAPGGCSTYRDLKYQEERSRELAAKHPLYVKLVQKETKTAWGGGIRTDVRISWKKAYQNGTK